jgi:hypothetical protein
VGDLFDLAVIAVAVLVCISLVLLAWTLGVSVTAAIRRTRAEVIEARLGLAVTERKLRGTAKSMRQPSEGDE